MAAHSTAVANQFLTLANERGVWFTQMQLQKLVYISHGWCLALAEQPLTTDLPAAWDYGPVYFDLWQSLKRYGRKVVTDTIKVADYSLFAENSSQVSKANFEQYEQDIIQKVFEHYGHFHAFQLSALTHKEGTPWYKVYVEQGMKKTPISNDSIREHFTELGNRRANAS